VSFRGCFYGSVLSTPYYKPPGCWIESGIGIVYLKKSGIGIDKFEIGIEVCYQKI